MLAPSFRERRCHDGCESFGRFFLSLLYEPIYGDRISHWFTVRTVRESPVAIELGTVSSRVQSELEAASSRARCRSTIPPATSERTTTVTRRQNGPLLLALPYCSPERTRSSDPDTNVPPPR